MFSLPSQASLIGDRLFEDGPRVHVGFVLSPLFAKPLAQPFQLLEKAFVVVSAQSIGGDNAPSVRARLVVIQGECDDTARLGQYLGRIQATVVVALHPSHLTVPAVADP